MNIRRLGSWEEEDILPIAEQFHAEAQIGATFHREACLANWRSLGTRVAFGLFKGDDLVGVLAGFIAPQFMTGVMLAQEMFWYVKPEHRGSLSGVRLFQEFEKWATEKQAYGIVMASLADNPPVAELYKKRGYRHIESHYLKIF